VPDYDRWGLLGRPPASLAVNIISSWFPFNYPPAQLLDRKKYSALIVVHPTDGDSTLFAEAARKKAIPVICIIMGTDNLSTGGPMLMTPDLLLTWGPEQLSSFLVQHAGFRPALKSTKAASIGALAHDALSRSRSIDAFRRGFPHIRDGTTVVTFAAYAEIGYPGQTHVCKLILDYFQRNKLDAHLIVRVRPGIDEAIWHDFQKANDQAVSLQIPLGALYTKWSRSVEIVRNVEQADMDFYAATLHRSMLVVSATFSTVLLDAYAAGIPSIPVGIISEPGMGGHFAEIYDAFGKNLSSYQVFPIVISEEQMFQIFDQVLLREEETQVLHAVGDVYERQVGVADGHAGQRAIDVIDRFIKSRN
jgi:hypothetical protein